MWLFRWAYIVLKNSNFRWKKFSVACDYFSVHQHPEENLQHLKVKKQCRGKRVNKTFNTRFSSVIYFSNSLMIKLFLWQYWAKAFHSFTWGVYVISVLQSMKFENAYRSQYSQASTETGFYFKFEINLSSVS